MGLLRISRLLSSAVLLGSLGFVAGASTSSATLTPHTPYPPCNESGLVIWIDTQGNGAAGTIYYELKFTNLSGHTCTTKGYPGVSAVTLAGHQLGPAAHRVSATVHALVLINGGSVMAHLGIVDAGNFSKSSCKPTTAAGLRVYAPNQTAAKIVPFPFLTCSGNVSSLSIYPVVA